MPDNLPLQSEIEVLTVESQRARNSFCYAGRDLRHRFVAALDARRWFRRYPLMTGAIVLGGAGAIVVRVIRRRSDARRESAPATSRDPTLAGGLFAALRQAITGVIVARVVSGIEAITAPAKCVTDDQPVTMDEQT